MKTKNYDQFVLRRENRPMDTRRAETNVKRIMKSIKEIGYIEARPILVNRKMEVLDGQNRLEACKRLKIPVVYEVYENGHKPGDDLKVIQLLNRNQSQWAMSDYIHHFSEIGVPFHRAVKRYQEQHGYGMSACVILCADERDNIEPRVREGKNLRLNPDRESIAEFINDIHLEVPYAYNIKFIKAARSLFQRATGDQIKKLRKHIVGIPMQVSVTAFLGAFENIINKNTPENKRVSLIKFG